jgi:hypothetical protein
MKHYAYTLGKTVEDILRFALFVLDPEGFQWSNQINPAIYTYYMRNKPACVLATKQDTRFLVHQMAPASTSSAAASALLLNTSQRTSNKRGIHELCDRTPEAKSARSQQNGRCGKQLKSLNKMKQLNLISAEDYKMALEQLMDEFATGDSDTEESQCRG